MLVMVAVFVFPIALAYAAVCDLMSYEIPNRISLTLLAVYLVASVFGSLGFVNIGWHLAAGAAVLAVGILLFAAGIFGGGDAKLLAVCAVWLGWANLLKFFVIVALIGGVLALFLIAFRRITLPASWEKLAWIRGLHAEDGGIPYGVAIGLGGILMVPELPPFAFTARLESAVFQGIQSLMA